MLKKLLILPLLSVLSIGAFASADDYTILDTPVATDFVIDGHNVPIVLDTTQKTNFCVATSSSEWSAVDSTTRNNCLVLDEQVGELVPKSTTIIADNYQSPDGPTGVYYVPFSVSKSVVLKSLKKVATVVGGSELNCSSSCVLQKGTTYYFRLQYRYGYIITLSPYFVNSIIFDSDIEVDDESGYIPTIPSSFTSGLTSLLSNFGSTIVNWLPTIILLSLGIYVIFALFRVVRNYARSSFNG